MAKENIWDAKQMTIKFNYIGWCNTTDRDGSKHDKVWTAFQVNNTWYAGWGARGKKLSFKKHDSQRELMKVKASKEKKYNEVDSFQLFTIFPYFTEDVEKYLMYGMLANKIR